MIENIKQIKGKALVFILVEFLIVYASNSNIANALYSNTIALLCLISIYLLYKFKKQAVIWPDKTFSLLYWGPFVLLLISAIFSSDRGKSFFTGFTYIYWSALPLYAAYIVFQWQFHKQAIILAVNAALLTLSSYGVYQLLTSPAGTRIRSYIHQWNIFCDMLFLGVPILIVYIFLEKKNYLLRSISVFSTLLSCWMIVLSGSRGGIAGFVIGAFCLFIIRAVYAKKVNLKKFLLGTITIIAITLCGMGIFYTNFQHTNTSVTRSYDGERILLWNSSYQMWKDHKFAGVGLGRWQEEYQSKYISPKAREPYLKHSHNVFLYFLSSAGVFGAIGYLCFTFGLLIYLCKQVKKYPDDIFLNALLWSSVAIIIQSMVNAPLLRNFIMRLYSLYLGIGLASIAYHQRLKQKKEN